MNNHQPTLKQPTRSGRLLIGMPTVVGSRKKKPPVCDGRCSVVRKCTKCLRKRRAQADDRAARLEKRQARVEAGATRAAHLQVETDGTDKQSEDDDVEDEEYFDQWAPGLVLATPDRPVFTPTPDVSPWSR